jgi:Carboxypeptidase regulatory-like domain/TonB-dependent Receptor Plug Domain
LLKTHTSQSSNHSNHKSLALWFVVQSRECQKENNMFKQMMRVSGVVLLFALMGIFSPSFGQANKGTISGTVTDQAGAVVAGATVEATNTATSEKGTATTSDNGTYTISNLTPGVYDVTVTATGFAVATAKGLQVSISFNATQDLALAPQGAEATVIITNSDAQTQINTTDQQLSTLIDNKKIVDLPLLSRDPNALILLAPGTVQTQSGLGGFSVNGSRERNNNFMVDGVDNNDTEVPGIAGGLSTPNIDATQEFRVITGNFNAEYGRNTGAVINVATKNGTNEFHGNAYIYYRSDRFSARDFFDVTGGADALQRKQFGASIGGPIKKEKIFFFFNYEGDRFNFGSQELRSVPSAAARTGIFATPAGSCFAESRAAFEPTPGVVIPAGTRTPCGTLDIRPTSINNAFGLPLDPAILSLLNIYPAGNSHADDPVPGIVEAFRFSYLNRNHSDSTASRIDYRINDRHTLTGSHQFLTGVGSAGAESFPGIGDGIRSPQRGQLLSINLTSNINANIVNSFTFGGNRAKSRFNGAGDQGVSGTIPGRVRTAFSTNGYGTAAPFGGVNGEAISLGTGALTDLATFDTQFRFTGTTYINEQLTWVHGAHTFRGGFEHRWIYSNSATNFFRGESLNFDVPTIFGVPILQTAANGGSDVIVTGSSGTIQNFASFLYGFIGQQFQSQFFDKNGTRVDQNYMGFRVRETDFFFQDTWRVRPNFTLNYGLRYELKGVPYEVNGQLSTLVNQDPSQIAPGSVTVGGARVNGSFTFTQVGRKSENPGQGLWDNDFNNFAPRFGFAWSPGWESGFISKLTGGPGKTSIRGGYGIFYDRVFGNLFTNARGNPPFQQDFVNFAGDTLPFVDRPSTLTASPTVFAGDPRAFSGAEIFPVIFALPGNNNLQEKFATPYEQKWNFGFQRELGNQFLLEADYVGAKGTNLLRVIDGQLTSIPRCNTVRAATPGTANDPPCGGIISTSGGSNANRGRFNDAFFQVALNLAVGMSTYHSLQTRITKTLTNSRFGLGQIQAAYTWSHSIDNANDPLVGNAGESTRTFPRDSSGFAGGFGTPERGDSGFDVRHRFVLNFLYDVPFKFDNKVADAIFGNWSMSGIVTAQSAIPFGVFGSVDSAGSGFSQRADFASPGNPNNIPPTTRAPNPRVQTGPERTLFANPVPPSGTAPTFGRQGSVSRNSFRGPQFHKTDFSLIKRIPLTERYKFTIRADFFNIFNRVNFGVPDGIITSDTFGRSTFTVSLPRVIQFAGRFEF